MDLLLHLRIQAHANRLANQRLHGAMVVLRDTEFQAPRTGYFPSLAATLNHVLEVDGYYIAALRGETALAAGWWDGFQAAPDLPTLATRQAASDAQLLEFVLGLDDRAADAVVTLPRGGGRIQHERAGHVLLHLFQHQVHHRGQAHAMLAGTTVKPPQLDEFINPSEAHLRTADMALAGFAEAEVYGPPPVPPS